MLDAQVDTVVHYGKRSTDSRFLWKMLASCVIDSYGTDGFVFSVRATGALTPGTWNSAKNMRTVVSTRSLRNLSSSYIL